MGLPVVLPGLPPPDTNLNERIVLGGLDLTLPIVTDYGQVFLTGRRLDGWSGGTESTRDVSQRAYRPGAVASRYPQSKPRLMTLALMLTAESPAAMREAWDLLNVAASKDDTALVRDQWGLRRSATVFRQGDITETLYPTALVKGWACQLKAADPRKYSEPLVGSTALPNTTGGFVFPLTYPATSNAVTVTGLVSLRNDGNEQAPVVLRIDGPVVAPQIAHVGTGRTLTFASSYQLPAGNWLDIDIERRRILENGIADRSQFVTSRGFFSADPGANQYAFTADAYDAGALLTVTTASAWE